MNEYKINPDTEYTAEEGIEAEIISEDVTIMPPVTSMNQTAATPEEPVSTTVTPAEPAYTAPAQPVHTAPAPKTSTYTATKPTSRKRSSFGRTAAVVCLAAILGGSSLGLGATLGQGLSNKYLTAAEVTNTTNEARTDEILAEEADQPAQEVFSAQSKKEEVIPLSAQANNVSSIVRSVSQSVVSIRLTAQSQNFFGQSAEQTGAGSGIIFHEDAEKVYIVTNYHVIESANKVSISIDDDKEVPATFVGSDSQSDLAVISVLKSDLTETGISYEIADFGDSDQLEVGETVVAIGNAMGEGKTATLGIISAKNKQITIDGKTLSVIQTDAAINPGNSGGALANAEGLIIGINTAKLSSSGVEGMGYSIPSNEAKTIFEDLLANGSVQKPYLGIQGMTVTEEMQQMYGLPSTGVYVNQVVQGSGAANAGIRQTDIIVGFGDEKITSIEELTAAIEQTKTGDTVKIYLYRNGSTPIVVDASIQNMNGEVNF